MAPKPSLVFIFPDQLGAHFLPSYGNEFVIAPNLSAFAEQGLQFNRTYANCPLCTPYRRILFTGRNPHQTAFTQNGYRIPSGERVLATLLNEAGYRTSYDGKWHLSGQGKGLVSGLHGGGRTNHRVPIDRRWAPPDQRAGFTEFVGWDVTPVGSLERRGLGRRPLPSHSVQVFPARPPACSDVRSMTVNLVRTAVTRAVSPQSFTRASGYSTSILPSAAESLVRRELLGEYDDP